MSWLQKLLYGVDPDEEQRRSDDLDAARRRENLTDADKYGAEWLRQTEVNDELAIQNTQADIDAGFDEGLREGAENVTGFVSKPFAVAGEGLGAVLKGIWRGVPWWVWLALVVALFFWLGGGNAVRAYVNRKTNG